MERIGTDTYPFKRIREVGMPYVGKTAWLYRAELLNDAVGGRRFNVLLRGVTR